MPNHRLWFSGYGEMFVRNCTIVPVSSASNSVAKPIYKSLTPQKQLEMKYENWIRVFDVTPFENEWMRRGSWIQATFWVLTKDMIKKVRYFKAAKHREQPYEE